MNGRWRSGTDTGLMAEQSEQGGGLDRLLCVQVAVGRETVRLRATPACLRNRHRRTGVSMVNGKSRDAD